MIGIGTGGQCEFDDKTNDVVGCKLSNSDRSKLQDIARNMNPSYSIQIEQVKDIAVVYVPEGKDKPYTVNGHFYLRYGANSQQLGRDDMRDLFQRVNKISLLTQMFTQIFTQMLTERLKSDANVDGKAEIRHKYDQLPFERNI